jgi:bifunctional non-homologous end joining protein LigD
MSVKFTHLDKVFWPKERYTKGDVIAYYERIAPYLLPYLKDRAESLNRFPDGVKGKHFYQKNVDPNQLPRFVKCVSLRARSARKTVDYGLQQQGYASLSRELWLHRNKSLVVAFLVV